MAASGITGQGRTSVSESWEPLVVAFADREEGRGGI